MIKKVIINEKDTGFTVSTSGQVFNKKGKLVKGYLSKAGYPKVSINGKSYFIHRLVAIAFIPNPKNLKYINHRDGLKTNHHISNLHWCSQEYNLMHAAYQLDKMTFLNPKYVQHVLLPMLKEKWSNTLNKGVSYYRRNKKKVYRVTLCTTNNTQKTIGYYEQFSKAVEAYKRAYLTFFGEPSTCDNYCEKTLLSNLNK